MSCKFYGLGSDGTVGANKNSIKIIGDHTDKYAQAYFAYDSKKSGGLTVSHLRFGDTPIRSHLPDRLRRTSSPATTPAYVTTYDMVSALQGRRHLPAQLPVGRPSELDAQLPASMKQLLAKKHAKFYTIDAVKLAAQVGMGNRINTIMQAAFFKLADIIPYEKADEYMKAYAKKTYGKKGDDVVKKNWDAIDIAISGLNEVKVPAEWADATTGAQFPSRLRAPPSTSTTFVQPDPGSGRRQAARVRLRRPTARVPTGTTKFEKRGIAVKVPEWIPDNCIQCGQCSLVCPHACIRPYPGDRGRLTERARFLRNQEGHRQGSSLATRTACRLAPLDCTGCGNCVEVCPAKTKALEMKPLAAESAVQEANWEFAMKLPEPRTIAFNKNTVKGSQFMKPLFEFSGACAGCGETPYVKLVTQLFGDRMMVANATGCSSIYGGSAPTCPYTVNDKGHGPAWANSLFEDNAEFGFGMNLAVNQRRAKLAENVEKLIAIDWVTDDIKAAGKEWLENMHSAEGSKAAAAKLIAACEDGIDMTGVVYNGKDLTGTVCECDACKAAREVLADKDLLVKKSVWIFGGDGWAYDIGYGGLDHVLAQSQDVNVLVLDTEVYSNTGGQSSKSTPTGSVAKFAAAGKRTKKKDLGMMAMSYGYVYVAQRRHGRQSCAAA